MEPSQSSDLAQSLLKGVVKNPQGQIAIFGLGLSAAALLLIRNKWQTEHEEKQDDQDEDLRELAHLDDHLNGLEKIFSAEPQRTSRFLSAGVMRKYSFAVGLPNVANTCYMNSLLQALSGCTKFTSWVERLWKFISIDETENDDLAVYCFVRSIRELRDGCNDASEWSEHLHDLLCSADTSSSSRVPFTSLFEQQDSHDLMFYLLEKVTKITAKFARQRSRKVSLALSMDLLQEARAERNLQENPRLALSAEDASTIGSSQISNVADHLPQSVLAYKRKANSLLGLNPLASIACNTIECKSCGPAHALNRQQVEYALTVPMPFDSMTFGGQDRGYDLLRLMQGLFRPETIEDYTCIRCSVNHYLEQQRDTLQNSALKQFLERLVIDREELDEDQFREAWQEWKARSGDKTRLTIDFIKRNITKSMHLMRQPPILCIHLNRVAYAHTGAEVLNSAKVDYPSEFKLNQVLPKEDLAEIGGEDTVYRLAALIEHIGMTPRSGHYMAYKRLFPENIQDEDGHLSFKWLKANDERLTIIEERELLGRKRSAYLLFYQRVDRADTRLDCSAT